MLADELLIKAMSELSALGRQGQVRDEIRQYLLEYTDYREPERVVRTPVVRKRRRRIQREAQVRNPDPAHIDYIVANPGPRLRPQDLGIEGRRLWDAICRVHDVVGRPHFMWATIANIKEAFLTNPECRQSVYQRLGDATENEIRRFLTLPDANDMAWIIRWTGQ